ncbi:MAG: acetyl-CoA carboxylase biotin carboxyl carrier protein subunit [Fibrella sp.]|nr:acetyl-CoA carboxylase biotin carboxyl carrier protein subunit [Armatimonadota bacterium]
MDHSIIEAFAEAFANAPRLAEMEVRSPLQGTLRFRRALHSAEKKPRPTSKPAVPVSTLANTAVVTAPTPSTDTLVTSTLVGVFRAAQKVPVGVGSVIKAGQTIGLIEVMRLSDEISAPISGTISEIFVVDGQPVEYGQALFEIIADIAKEEQENDA